MIELFDKQECPFCWRVRLALEELELPWRRLDRSDPAVLARWQRLSSRGTVPVMVAGRTVLDDSRSILDYLQNRYGGLLPDGSAARRRVLELVRYADDGLGAAIRELIFEKRERPPSQWDRQRIESARIRYLACLPTLEQHLAGRRGWFGPAYSMAECALVPRVALATHYGVGIPENLPGLCDWYDRARLRRSFAATAPQGLQSSQNWGSASG